MNRRTTQLLLAATAFAAPALLTACGSDATADDRAANPGTTRTVDVADLLTDADTVYSDGADWFRLATGNESLDGNGDLAHPCLAQGLSGLGATDVVRADFELRNSDAPDIEVKGDLFTQLIGQYDDEAAASAAYDQVLAALAKCEDRPGAITEYRSFEPRDVQGAGADAGDRAQVVDAQYGPLPAALEDGDSAYIMETGVALVGDRVTVLTSVIVGQDYNFLEEDGGTPVNQMLPKAVDRLG
ncbi:hypothetical protein ASE01_08275 [Nocardioides sp. Root190]|uniref:hypothetical protein n=1 Tax=Nocardioides sp. Root190 TaxID=1736488 RepID=UPI0006F6A4A2|nr:hypothetical protein [Nocardioides sp. Root190]KRB78140.1 hypothetical protein ASE01_08275 [Nocardioides sp. Root190]